MLDASVRRWEVGGRSSPLCVFSSRNKPSIFGSGVFSQAAGSRGFFVNTDGPNVCPSSNGA